MSSGIILSPPGSNFSYGTKRLPLSSVLLNQGIVLVGNTFNLDPGDYALKVFVYAVGSLETGTVFKIDLFDETTQTVVGVFKNLAPNPIPANGFQEFLYGVTAVAGHFYSVRITTKNINPSDEPPPQQQTLLILKSPGSWIEVASSGGGGAGQQGITGVWGITGLQGITGVWGLTGEDGIGGSGSTGLDGITGSIGITGADNPSGSGSTGFQGITGVWGIAGAGGFFNGITGVAGVTGGVGGFGITGLSGITGVTVDGIQNVTGISGITGLQGITGADIPGITGRFGITGVRGITGAQAATGNCPTGVQGITGVWNITGAWAATGNCPTGVQGITGRGNITGVWGITGPQRGGITGLWGITGLQGITGVWGITGQFNITGVWGITGESQNTTIGVFTWNAGNNPNTSGNVDRIFVSSGVDGSRVAPRFGTFVDCFMSLGSIGRSSTTVCNLFIGTGNNAPGVSVPWNVKYAALFAAANQSMIASNNSPTNATVRAGTPQAPWNTGFEKGSVFTMSVDQVGTAAGLKVADLSVVLIVQYTGS